MMPRFANRADINIMAASSDTHLHMQREQCGVAVNELLHPRLLEGQQHMLPLRQQAFVRLHGHNNHHQLSRDDAAFACTYGLAQPYSNFTTIQQLRLLGNNCYKMLSCVANMASGSWC